MEKKKIIITGGAGFLGSYIAERFVKDGYHVVLLDLRKPPHWQGDFVEANLTQSIPADPLLAHPHGVIHLAGKNIFGRFTTEHKKAIYSSRVLGTEHLVNFFKKETFRPKVLVSASAVGWYGDRGNAELDELWPAGETFLSQVVQDWEAQVKEAQLLGIRTVILRQGHIFGHGGFLSALKPVYHLGFGGPIGTGKQWLPWIHIHDLFHLYEKALRHDHIRGVYNAVAPQPVQYRDFSKLFAKLMKRPHVFRVPRWLLAIRFGREFAHEMTVSQKVISHRMGDFAYRFQFGRVEQALRDLVVESLS